jgi:phosphomannomutase
MTDHTELLERTHNWITGDPDDGTRRELERLVADEDWDALKERMAGVLEFGTAGIRGAVEAGSNRMNRAVVIKTTAGLSDFLLANRSGPVVVGFDGRTSSRQFSEDTVGVLTAAGHEVRFFTEPVPTPLVAFAAKRHGAAAAIVVTASHNPPADNGYKVYGSNGAQIVPPVDTEIAAAIAAVGPASEVPRIEGTMGGASPSATPIDAEAVYAAYWSEVDRVRTRRKGSDIAIAYTPIHGVGWRYVERLFRDAGYKRLRVVRSQRDPHGRLPQPRRTGGHGLGDGPGRPDRRRPRDRQ